MSRAFETIDWRSEREVLRYDVNACVERVGSSERVSREVAGTEWTGLFVVGEMVVRVSRDMVWK